MGVLIKNLHVELGDFLLKGIDLDVEKGEYFVVLGPTGAGKTILLETIAGLHQPLKGEIWLDGEEITSIPPEKRGIGFVYQDYALFPHLSVADNIAFGLKIGGMSSIERERRVKEIAELLGIEHLLWRRPMNLSGGEKQRVALARALVISPRLLLLDEPLSAIDPAMREGLQRELLLLHEELNVTTLHVTHDFEEAVALADRIAIMKEGLIVQVGNPYEVFRQPKTKFVALFVGARNVFEGSVRGKEDGVTKVEIEGLEIETLTELTGRVHVSLRPEDILISTRPLRSSARNSFKGEVARILDKGPTVYVMVRVPPDFVCLITKRSFEEMGLREGVQVYITFKASAVHVF
jgi:molybdopterin-binding protein